jgi:hypothetical protein
MVGSRHGTGLAVDHPFRDRCVVIRQTNLTAGRVV